MLAWLGEWLQSVIAVILLAVIVELVLPNNKMLRYSRLVIGLILLLTMLNPLLNLFQKDFTSQLAASYSLWDEQFEGEELNVPTLEEINKRASELKVDREQASEQLTKLGLEEAMKQQLLNQSDANVQQVAVQLGWNKGTSADQTPYIESITVTLKQVPSESQVEEVAVQEPIKVSEIKVQVDVTVSEESESPNPETEQKPKQQSGYHAVQDEQALQIISILAASWNVKENQIYVQAKS
ncbi:MAG: stage III sporulation protein AF [Candidatus Pristimantibacillus lignocellulolyticus]|uniref:Stage III sporulation protein AF n=1 Tax=Candidatus Pristimantibacillus lignocellulolyticus TaxID=2994561 RepID=A0A9J6ZE04_9BACL|nr:MAG: stage III sporulation protein AF [Candidatus Pristimantibacillus lignocellulolyticus]